MPRRIRTTRNGIWWMVSRRLLLVLLLQSFAARTTTTMAFSREVTFLVPASNRHPHHHRHHRPVATIHGRRIYDDDDDQYQSSSSFLRRHRMSSSFSLQNGRNNNNNMENLFIYDWDGDDIRRWTKWRRRWWRSTSHNGGLHSPVRTTLVVLNSAMFVYQVVNTLHWLATKRFPQYWPRQAVSMTWDVLWGNTIPGPLTKGFWFTTTTTTLSRQQPHRYLTAGFLHGSVLHLVVNLMALQQLPAWLETGLGSSLYATAYLVAIVTGNMGHAYMTSSSAAAGSTAALGASGGICGLYGLQFAALMKMGNDRAASMVFSNMIRIIVAGLFLPSISNAAHAGGFVGGLLVGLLWGPSYGKSYAARRKWSLQPELHSREYRAVMGFGVEPRPPRRWWLGTAWVVALLYALSDATLRTVPLCIWRGLVHPGSL